MLVSDIYMPLEKTKYLHTFDTVKEYKLLSESTNHSRYPVVNKNMRVVGIITAKDVLEKPDTQIIERIMTREPRVVKKDECGLCQPSDDLGWLRSDARRSR